MLQTLLGSMFSVSNTGIEEAYPRVTGVWMGGEIAEEQGTLLWQIITVTNVSSYNLDILLVFYFRSEDTNRGRISLVSDVSNKCCLD